MQAQLLIAAGVAALAAGASTFAEQRRMKRRATHGPGLMPWPTITFATIFAALMLLALALKT